MPVNTEIIRDGERVKIRWGWWHIERLAEAMLEECPTHKLFMGFPNEPDPNSEEKDRYGEFTFTMRHEFTDETDGEVFIIEPGDRYKAWRV